MVVDSNSHSKIIDSDKVKVSQYTIYHFDFTVDYESPRYNYQISYRKDEWSLHYKSSSYSFNTYLNYIVHYEAAECFSVIVYINIHVEDSKLSSYSEINITVLDDQLTTSSAGMGGLGAKALESKKAYNWSIRRLKLNYWNIKSNSHM